MKIQTIALLALCLAAGPALAQSEKPSTRIMAAKSHSVKATVQDVDYDQRQITLKLPDGKTRRFEVGPGVQRLSEIKKGDEIRIDYLESMALALKNSGSKLPPTGRSGEVIEHGSGKLPGGTAVSTIDVTATVEEVDRKNREVTIKGPAGHVDTITVDPEIGDLKGIKKGDQIAVRYTEALAVTVQRARDSSSSTPPAPAPTP